MDGFVSLNSHDVIRMECFGPSLTAKINDKVLSTATYNEILTGNVALDMFDNSAVTDTQVSNFAGGLITGSSNWWSPQMNAAMRGLRK